MLSFIAGIFVLLGVLAFFSAPITLVMLSSLKRRVNHLENTVQKILQEKNNNKKEEVASASKAPESAYVSAAEAIKPASQAEIQQTKAFPEVFPQTAAVPEIKVAPSPPPPLPEPSLVSEEQALLARLQTMYETDKPANTAKKATVSTPQPGIFERLERWFIGGNVPVNIGILVLLAGVIALLKYATDQGILRVPIELRLIAVSLAAMGALVFAWNKRPTHPVFSLAVQGGAIGVLLLVIFAAHKLYRLLPGGTAFVLSAGLIAGLAVLAVLQYSRTLAVLGILAGFLAPIGLSDGSGNHVGLFSWYALLNAGIFVMAWLRPWRALNLLGFAFTWGIGIIWGVLQYSPEKFVSAQVFLLLFFVFYLCLPLFYARRAQSISSGQARIDGTLVFGTPLIAFSLQSGLLAQRWPLALCALGLAMVYLALAYMLSQRAHRWQHLTQAYAILAVGFATLAVPLALSAKATASVYALEGAALVWLGLTQRNQLAYWSGIGLQLAAVFSWLLALDSVSIQHFSVITNAMYISGLLIALVGFVIAWLHTRHDDAEYRALAMIAYIWGVFWWLIIGTREIFTYADFHYRQYHVAWPPKLNALLLLFGFSAWLAAMAQHHLTTYPVQTTGRTKVTTKRTISAAINALTGTVLFCLSLAFIIAVMQYFDSYRCGDLLALAGKFKHIDCSSPVRGVITGGTWVWLLFAALGTHSLYLLRSNEGPLSNGSQLVWLLLWACVWMLEAPSHWAGGWYGLMLALPWLVLVTLSLHRWQWLRWPLGAGFDEFRNTVQIIGLAVLGLWWLIWLFNAGNSDPLVWIVVLNPLDLAQIAVLLLLALCLYQSNQRLPVWLALLALLLISVITLRTVHHLAHLPWSMRLFSSGITQASLTVVWSVLGVAAWVSGSKRGSWGLWLSGVLLMGVVLLKLLLVDRSNLGNLPGISAFIIYGLFCTVVGGLAPAPPRNTDPAKRQRARQ